MSDKLTPSEKAMFDRISRAKNPVLEISLTASGGRSASVLASLVRKGLVSKVDDPEVKDRRTGQPAAAYVIAREATR